MDAAEAKRRQERYSFGKLATNHKYLLRYFSDEAKRHWWRAEMRKSKDPRVHLHRGDQCVG